MKRNVIIHGNKRRLRVPAFMLAAVLFVNICGSMAVQAAETDPFWLRQTISGEEEKEVIRNDSYGAVLTDLAYSLSGKNTIMSPLSVNMALAMALEGAEGKTKEEIENYLGIKKDGLDQYIYRLLLNVTSNGQEKIIVSNAFWFLAGSKVNRSYLETLKKRYAAETGELDLSDTQAAADLINTWCSSHTNGLIPKIVTPEDLASVTDVILNTVYFKSAWMKSVETIRTETFFGPEGETEAEFLYSKEKTYYENEKAVAFAKPYKGHYSFIGILPKEEGDFNLADLDIESLLASGTREYEVHAEMPKLNVESGGSITQILKEMGIQSAFQAETADFSGISDSLYITDVIHKTKLILDENGTEAAAATAVMMALGAMMRQVKEKTVRLDRPYAFLIYDESTGTVLFTGKIVEP